MGDSFGLINSLFSALALCFVVVALWYQSLELRTQSDSIKDAELRFNRQIELTLLADLMRFAEAELRSLESTNSDSINEASLRRRYLTLLRQRMADHLVSNLDELSSGFGFPFQVKKGPDFVQTFQVLSKVGEMCSKLDSHFRGGYRGLSTGGTRPLDKGVVGQLKELAELMNSYKNELSGPNVQISNAIEEVYSNLSTDSPSDTELGEVRRNLTSLRSMLTKRLAVYSDEESTEEPEIN